MSEVRGSDWNQDWWSGSGGWWRPTTDNHLMEYGRLAIVHTAVTGLRWPARFVNAPGRRCRSASINRPAFRSENAPSVVIFAQIGDSGTAKIECVGGVAWRAPALHGVCHTLLSVSRRLIYHVNLTPGELDMVIVTYHGTNIQTTSTLSEQPIRHSPLSHIKPRKFECLLKFSGEKNNIKA